MHINSGKIHAERITQKVKELVNDLNYDGIKFPVSKEDFSKIAGLKIMVGPKSKIVRQNGDYTGHSVLQEKFEIKLNVRPGYVSVRP